MSRTGILCAADLHLGVRPSRLPDDADAARFATTAAWRRLVARALSDDVGLVLLAGDVVDRANRYFEAIGPLEAGLAELAAAGVTVCAVAGNHDFDVLGRLAAGTRGGGEGSGVLHLLGAEGGWQRFTWRDPGSGRPLLHVDGWSFPALRVTEDPAALYDLPRPDGGAPVLGLVHGDLGQASSRYAPLSRASLARLVPDAWVVGHVHRPALLDLDLAAASGSSGAAAASGAGRWILVPGSPQPLDPGEPGRHGAWRTTVEAGWLARPELAPVANLRYEPLAVDLDGTECGEEAEDRAAAALRERLREIATEVDGDPLEQVLLRVVLEGRTVAHRALPGVARRLLEWRGEAGGVAGAVEAARADARPAVDLERLAARDDPPGLVAALLAELDAGGGARVDRLAEELADRLEPLWRGTYAPLADGADGADGAGGADGEGPAEVGEAEASGAPIDRELASHLATGARRLLDALLAQRGEGAA